MRKMQKQRVTWRRLSVRVSQDMYDELEDRAALAKVSVSRLVFSILQRKKITIVPGFAEFAYQIEQICKELSTTKNSPEMLAELVESVNRMGQMFQWGLQKAQYPYIVKQDGKYKPSIYSKKIKNQELLEGENK